MALEEVTASTIDPVTLAEAKTHLRVTNTNDDTYIAAIIDAATRAAEIITRRALFTQTWRYHLDVLPYQEILLPLPPLQSVTHIKYYDTDNTQQTLSSDDYVVDTISMPARICRAFGVSWPSTYERPNAIEVQFICGLTQAADLPKGLKQAILYHIAHFYDMREPVSLVGFGAHSIPLTIQSLYASYRVMRFY